MRLGFAAAALSAGLLVCTVQPAMTQTAAPPGTAPSEAAGSAAAGANDAAAKHAKRTACLKNAKTKKLVGPEKTAYLKDCIAAP
ncbi:MAG: hypothetical protein ACLPV8_06630 [Steroidobacteraceae bacterium]